MGLTLHYTSDRKDPNRNKYIPDIYTQDSIIMIFEKYYELRRPYQVFKQYVEGKPLFPLPEELRAKGVRVPSRTTPVRSACGTGLSLTYAGMLKILINPMYDGHIWNDEVGWIEDPRMRFLPNRDWFWTAYWDLSPTDMDGLPNPRYIRQRKKRWEETEGRKRMGASARKLNGRTALLGGVLESMTNIGDGTEISSYAYPDCYRMVVFDQGGVQKSQQRFMIKDVDSVYLTILKKRMIEAPHFFAQFRDYEKQQRAKEEAEKKKIENLKLGFIKQMKMAEMKMDQADEPELFNKYQAAYKSAKKRLSELEQPKSGEERLRKQRKQLTFLEGLERAGEHLQAFKREQLLTIIEVTTSQVMIRPCSPWFFYLAIEWNEWTGWNPETYVARRTERGMQKQWTNEEIAFLRETYEEGDIDMILYALPERSWDAIRIRASEEGLHRKKAQRSLLRDKLTANFTLVDLQICEELGIDPSTRFNLIASANKFATCSARNTWVSTAKRS